MHPARTAPQQSWNSQRAAHSHTHRRLPRGSLAAPAAPALRLIPLSQQFSYPKAAVKGTARRDSIRLPISKRPCLIKIPARCSPPSTRRGLRPRPAGALPPGRRGGSPGGGLSLGRGAHTPPAPAHPPTARAPPGTAAAPVRPGHRLREAAGRAGTLPAAGAGAQPVRRTGRSPGGGCEARGGSAWFTASVRLRC